VNVSIVQHFGSDVDADMVRDAAMEGVDIGLGARQRTATRVNAGDASVML